MIYVLSNVVIEPAKVENIKFNTFAKGMVGNDYFFIALLNRSLPRVKT